MVGMLIAYDADGNVTHTLDKMVARDEHGHVIGLIDFVAHEEAGGSHTDIWHCERSTQSRDESGRFGPLVTTPAKGSKVWPEWLGGRAHEFRVELAGPPGRKHIAALVHKTSGHRRERDAIHAAIAAAPEVDGVRDLRRVVGGPQKPLHLDEHGRDSDDPPTGTPAHLPIIGR